MATEKELRKDWAPLSGGRRRCRRGSALWRAYAPLEAAAADVARYALLCVAGVAVPNAESVTLTFTPTGLPVPLDGVPLIKPVLGWMLNPGGNPVAGQE